jgi:large subunit ribosomal protein L5e
MPFIKVTKTRAYFKRYQTQYRRRREGKTDYYARKRLVFVNLNKYLTPRYRLVARITNSKIIAQIAYSTLAGDKILCQADSSELSKWGLTTGQTSYPAAYATGLLLARRLLTQLKMADMYKGNDNVDGKDYDVSTLANADRRPFKAVLDIGIRRPTVGHRVFAVLKGATDGGLHVPHNTNKFPGFTKGEEKSKNSYDAETHRVRIFGGHIDEYMEKLKQEDEGKYMKQFSKWVGCLQKAGVESVEDLFEKVFESIRADPVKVQKKSFKPTLTYTDENRTIVQAGSKKYRRDRRLTLEQRKERVAQRKSEARQEIAQLS